MQYNIIQQQQNQLSKKYEGEILQVVGRVSSIPDTRLHSTKFNLNIHSGSLNNSEILLPSLIRLSWYGGQKHKIRLGDIWKFNVKLKRPRGMINPDVFDYERWLFLNRIGATGYVYGGSLKQHFVNDDSSFISKIRRNIFNQTELLIQNYNVKGVIQALLLGERSNITTEQWQLFRDTGTSHLMAISGLHVGLVAGFAFVMTRFIWSRAYKLTLIVASQKVAAIFSIMAALFYAALAGFAVPTQRALIMCSVVLIAVLFDRKILSKDVLVIALLLVILNDPFATLSQGFWLSFTAVAVIFYISNRIFSESKLSLLLTVQLSVFIGLSPLLFLFFNELSFTAPLVNIVAIPYVSFIVVPVVLLAGVLSEWQYLADPLFRFSEAIVEGLLHILSLAQAILPAYSFIQFPFYLILTLSLSIIWILAPKGWPYRWLGLTGVIPLFLFQPDRPDKGDAHVTILDVGQGQAIVVETAKHLLLFDSGPAYGERFNTGSAIVVPFIKSTGLKKIDGMIVSHQDSDHMGGYRAIESQFRIDHLYSPVEFPSGATHWQQCNKGIQWSWDDVKFEFLNSNLEDELIKKENNQACVLKVSTASTALLIPSDIEKEGEQVLLKGSGGLKADYLIAPHHGSKTSSTEAFINAVGPTWVFYSVGYRNRFNHPDPDVVYRYRKLGILDASTADNGAISIYISNKSSINTIEFERNLNNSWWRTQ